MAKRSAPMSPAVAKALKSSVGRFKGLLANNNFPDDERHNTAVALHITANGSQSVVLGPSATRALKTACTRFQELLANNQLPHEERHLTAIILDQVTTAMEDASLELPILPKP